MNIQTPCPIHASLAQQLAVINPQRVFVAYSGGLDSSVLLHGVCKLQLDVPLFAIHIHHGLSKHADDWLQHCQANGNGQVSGLEQAARLARYQVFEQHLKTGDVLLMAHHQDDQIETFMMRLMRGSGLTGLTAMEMSRSVGDGHLLRPLLNNSRQQIEEYAALNNVQHVEDDSNSNTNFDRNWWRHSLLASFAIANHARSFFPEFTEYFKNH